MLVILQTLQDKIDGQVSKSKEGNSTVVEVEPYFYRANAKPNVLFVSVTDKDGEVLDRLSIGVSGTTGKLQVNRFIAPVSPAYYANHAAADKTTKSDADTSGTEDE